MTNNSSVEAPPFYRSISKALPVLLLAVQTYLSPVFTRAQTFQTPNSHSSERSQLPQSQVILESLNLSSNIPEQIRVGEDISGTVQISTSENTNTVFSLSDQARLLVSIFRPRFRRDCTFPIIRQVIDGKTIYNADISIPNIIDDSLNCKFYLNEPYSPGDYAISMVVTDQINSQQIQYFSNQDALPFMGKTHFYWSPEFPPDQPFKVMVPLIIKQ